MVAGLVTGNKHAGVLSVPITYLPFSVHTPYLPLFSGSGRQCFCPYALRSMQAAMICCFTTRGASRTDERQYVCSFGILDAKVGFSLPSTGLRSLEVGSLFKDVVKACDLRV